MKKANVIMIILGIIYIILSIYLVFIKKDNIVYLGDGTEVIVKNDDIKITKNNKLMNFKKARILYNNEFIDGYIRRKKDDTSGFNICEVLNEEKKKIIFSNGLIAYSGNLNIKVGNYLKYSILTNTEKEKLMLVAEENNISGSISEAYRYDFDIDGDKKEESIYSFTIIEKSKINTLTFINTQDDYEIIDIKKDDYSKPNCKRSWFYRFIDFNNDDNYEIVLFQSNGDDSLGTYKIYQYINKSVIEIK